MSIPKIPKPEKRDEHKNVEKYNSEILVNKNNDVSKI